MSQDEARVFVEQRGAAYGFLASLYAHPLDATTIGRMASATDHLAADAGIATDIFDALSSPLEPAALAERLALEHARLFRGIGESYGPPPPYESLWREGHLMGETTRQVATRYLEAGYRPAGDLAPLDHIAEELRFMSALCRAEHDAQAEDAEGWRRHQSKFLEEHLTAWIGDYCRHLARETQDPFYRALADTTAAVVAQDAAHPGRGSEEASA